MRKLSREGEIAELLKSAKRWSRLAGKHLASARKARSQSTYEFYVTHCRICKTACRELMLVIRLLLSGDM